MNADRSSKRFAIVYPYRAHYREAIFELLSQSDAQPRYVIFSDRKSNEPSIATREGAVAQPEGTLNWRIIRSRWLTTNALWQSEALRIAIGRELMLSFSWAVCDTRQPGLRRYSPEQPASES